MAAFAMLHPTDEGDEDFVHCGDCGYYEPLCMDTWHIDETFDDLLDEAVALWEAGHRCWWELNTTGMLLYSTEQEIAAAFGTTGID